MTFSNAGRSSLDIDGDIRLQVNGTLTWVHLVSIGIHTSMKKFLTYFNLLCVKGFCISRNKRAKPRSVQQMSAALHFERSVISGIEFAALQ